MKKITLLKGDGIGPEIIDATVQVLKKLETVFGPSFEFQEALIGAIAIDKTGNPLPDETIEMCKNSDAVLMGAIGDPSYDNRPDIKVRPEQGLLKLRKTLGVFTNIRPMKIYDSLKELSILKADRLKNVDMVIYRELTGGIYFGDKVEGDIEASDLCKYEKYEIERICKQAFHAASKRRKKVTLVDKANVLASSRLWRKVFQNIAKDFPDIEVSYLFVDNAAMQLVLNPGQFDVMVTSNMFGDILSDLGSVIGGSIGILPSASKGNGPGLFEPVHGSYPQAKNKNIANPIGTVLSAKMMLDDLEMNDAAALLQSAVEYVLSNNLVTEDLSKTPESLSTTEVANELCKQIESLKKVHLNYKEVIH